jgi:hypothetical protein
MFKILLILGLTLTFFVGVAALQGCQGSQEDDQFINDDIPTDRRIGILKSLGGIKTESAGTHLLQLDNGDTILLKSLGINLDDDKYYGETIEVRGVLTYAKDSKPLMEVMNIDILEKYEPREEKQSKWITYDGSEYNFSIKYRDDFVLKENARGVTFEIPMEQEEDKVIDEDSEEDVVEEVSYNASSIVRIITDSKGPGEDLLTYLNLESDESEDLLEAGLTESKVGKNNLQAFKEQSMDGVGVSFYAEGGAYFYTISFEGGDDRNYLDAQNLFYEILSTFEVEDVDSVSDPPDEDEDFDINIDSPFYEGDSEEDIPTDTDNEEDQSDGASDDVDDMEEETDLPEGYSIFENESFDFTIQHPKSWYYEGSSSGETGVIRHYEFGDEPLDEADGYVFLDLMSGEIPSGSEVSAGGNTVTKVSSGDNIEIYIEGKTRNYRISGPASLESTLLTMAGSIK